MKNHVRIYPHYPRTRVGGYYPRTGVG